MRKGGEARDRLGASLAHGQPLAQTKRLAQREPLTSRSPAQPETQEAQAQARVYGLATVSSRSRTRRPPARGATGSDLVALEQLAPDDHALDLARALADQLQRSVAVDPLDLVLLGVAVAAVDAQALLGTET